MGTLAEIEDAILQLPGADVRALRDWLEESERAKALAEWTASLTTREEMEAWMKANLEAFESGRIGVSYKDAMRGIPGTDEPAADE